MSAATVGALAFGQRSLASINVLPSVSAVNGFTLYTVTDGFPSFSPANYRLRIDGLVKHPLTMTLDEILKTPSVTERNYYQCVTGWSVPHVVWTGIRLSDLLRRVEPLSGAQAVNFYSFDGAYSESLTMEQALQQDVMVAYKLDHKPLARAQGAPLRLVVPGMYGYKYIKWLNRIELVPHPTLGFWEQRGYDRDAYIGRSNGL